MAKILTQVKTALRFASGLSIGVMGSGTVAAWLFALFEWLNVGMDPTKGPIDPIAWGSMLATWVASGFVGQTIAANVARLPPIIWFVATIDAAILLFAYYLVPHPVFLIGAGLGFIVAFRLKDSDFLRMVKIVPASR